MSRTTLYRAIWIPSLLILASMVIAFARLPETLPDPGSSVVYTTSDRALSISHPRKWKAHALSMHSVASAIHFAPAPHVDFDVTSDLSGSLMADIDRSLGQMESNLGSTIPGMEAMQAKPRKSPLQKLHEAQGLTLQHLYPGYAEGKAVPLRIAGQEALASDFTDHEPGLLGDRAMFGRRITLLAADRSVTVMWHAPVTLRARLTPIFEEMLQSLHLGQGGG